MHVHHKGMKRRGGAGRARFITFSCVNRRRILATPRLRDVVSSHLRDWIGPHGISLHAWVVMSNHVHLLLTPRSEELPRSLAAFKHDIAVEVLRTVAGETMLWQPGGGYDREIWSHQHFWKTFEYIHHNPCFAGVAKLPSEWRWSSAREWFGRPRSDAPRVDPPPEDLVDLVGTS